jgi:uncharacterized BrkB/YihY/UPF0761 family membrane protein
MSNLKDTIGFALIFPFVSILVIMFMALFIGAILFTVVSVETQSWDDVLVGIFATSVCMAALGAFIIHIDD